MPMIHIADSSLFLKNSPISKKIFLLIILSKNFNFPYFCSIYVFCPNLPFWPIFRFFASPYFGHDAFMQHALHVLGVPAYYNKEKKIRKIIVALAYGDLQNQISLK